jgi:hypothetical protein
VTICIAALCQDGSTVIGISDRMMTVGEDIEYERALTKASPIAPHIVVMYSGDARIHSDLYCSVRREMHEDVARSVWGVKDVAEAYARQYAAERAKRAERDILKPLGLHSASFIASQKFMARRLVRDLAEKMRSYKHLDLMEIICGVNKSTGEGHVYTVDNGEIQCEDDAGFAAAGTGQWHATSRMLLNRHTRGAGLAETLFRTYSAKKRAEAAPGVGVETDMFILTADGLTIYHDGDYRIRRLEAIYQGYLMTERKAIESAETATARTVTGELRESGKVGEAKRSIPGPIKYGARPGILGMAASQERGE